jgi:L-asparaginase II
MIEPARLLVSTTRGPIVENRHTGILAIADASGAIREAWGDTDKAILPRSAIKMIQALPLLESGAAEAARLGDEHLALACASHEGASIHTERVAAWLNALGLDEGALRCGPQPPRDAALKAARIPASRIMNNCSGKHTGFLTYARHIGTPLDTYLDPAGRVQGDIEAAFAEVTGQEAPLSYGIDGCSAPNFVASTAGVARSMALFAAPPSGVRGEAMARLRDAMRAHPLLISGEKRACAALIEATNRRAVVKTGADGVYTGIVPERGLGFCLKIDDGSRTAAEALCAAALVQIGVLEAEHPVARALMNTQIRNFNGELVGKRRVTLDA